MPENSTYSVSEVMGELSISDEVVANIAAIAAKEIEGVAGLVGNKTGEFMSNFGVKNSYGKSIRVEMVERIVSVDMSLIVKYGFSLPKTGAAVQERVKNAIENMTGLEVSDVNVRIEGIDIEK